MTFIRAGIAGGSGYTGGELVRLLLRHPHVTIRFVYSRHHAGRRLSDVHRDLLGETDMLFAGQLHDDIDVLFLCLGHGESAAFLREQSIPASVRIIDLSQDFRLARNEAGRTWVYGLPELHRSEIVRASSVANPGCFATAIQLGLLPLAARGELRQVYCTAITGSTGAGARMDETLHFSWRSNNLSAYKTLRHQHLNEIRHSLQSLQPDQPVQLYFVPWRGSFTRGIFASSVTGCVGKAQDEALDLFRAYFISHPFIVVAESMIDLKMVTGTNKCAIYPEVADGHLVVHSAIDNLLKGASGQAVQNMNLMFGIDETVGLQLKATAF
jgi:N-acetyl-gamma-glutamyl-phosphate reductase